MSAHLMDSRVTSKAAKSTKVAKWEKGMSEEVKEVAPSLQAPNSISWSLLLSMCIICSYLFEDGTI